MLRKSFRRLRFSRLRIGHRTEFFGRCRGRKRSFPERLDPLFLGRALAVEVWHVVGRRDHAGLFRGRVKNEPEPIRRHLERRRHGRRWRRRRLNVGGLFRPQDDARRCRRLSGNAGRRPNDWTDTSRRIPRSQRRRRIRWRRGRSCVDVFRQRGRICNSLETLELSRRHRTNVFPGFGPKTFRHRFRIERTRRWNLSGLWNRFLPARACLGLFLGRDQSRSWYWFWNLKRLDVAWINFSIRWTIQRRKKHY